MKNYLTELTAPKPIEILGINIHPLSIFQLNSLIAHAIKYQQKWIIAHQNLHGVYIPSRP